MKLGVVAALRRELEPTRRMLQQLFPEEGHLCEGETVPFGDIPPFAFTISGIGCRLAERAALDLAGDCQSLISVGFCGGLDDSLKPGDLILGGTSEYEASPSLLELAKRTGPHRLGTMHTTDRVINDFEEKRSIARTTGAMAVEMEAAAVGKVAQERGLAFLCVKVVLDTPSQPLASTYASFGRVMLDLLRRPWIVGRMIGDGKRAKLAAEKLRDFFVAFRKEISPSGA